jgi:hypothetical protein
MKKEFVTYIQAVDLKELGFDERCFTRYYESGKLADSLSYLHHNYFGQVNAPLYQQAFRWFRDKHQLQHEIVYDMSDDLINKVYVYTIFGTDRSEEYKTYEDAEEGCINELIKIVKNGK